MRIIVGATTARLSGPCSPSLLLAISDALTYTVDEYQPWRPQPQRWVSQPVSLTVGLTFPAGLLGRAVRAAKRAGATVEIEREHPPFPPPERLLDRLPDGSALFPDQVAALQAALDARTGCLNLGVNFGKTHLLAALLASYPAEPGLVLINRGVLAQQLARDLSGFLRERVGLWGSGSKTTGRVTVATIQALSKRHPPWLDRIRLLLVDEAQTISPVQWFGVLRACPAPFRIGVGGSLAAKEVEPLIVEAYLGPICHTVKAAALVEAGRSSSTTALMPHFAIKAPTGTSYEVLYPTWIARNEARNGLLVSMVQACVAHGLPALVLAYLREHIRLLTRALRAAGVEAQSVDGTAPGLVRDRLLHEFQDGAYPVLVGSGILNAGINLSRARVLVNAGAWKSELATGQKQGRIARLKLDGDHRALLLDPFDLGSPILKRHADARRRLYEKEGCAVRVGSWGDLAPVVTQFATHLASSKQPAEGVGEFHGQLMTSSMGT